MGCFDGRGSAMHRACKGNPGFLAEREFLACEDQSERDLSLNIKYLKAHPMDVTVSTFFGAPIILHRFHGRPQERAGNYSYKSWDPCALFNLFERKFMTSIKTATRQRIDSSLATADGFAEITAVYPRMTPSWALEASSSMLQNTRSDKYIPSRKRTRAP